jgi:hypothetical protein
MHSLGIDLLLVRTQLADEMSVFMLLNSNFLTFQFSVVCSVQNSPLYGKEGRLIKSRTQRHGLPSVVPRKFTYASSLSQSFPWYLTAPAAGSAHPMSSLKTNTLFRCLEPHSIQ